MSELPNNASAEEAVLGSILIDESVIHEIRDFLSPDHFYLEKNSLIYESMLNLCDRGEPVDLITLTDELARAGHLEDVGGEARVIGLINAVPTAINAVNYGRIVERASKRRKMIGAASTIANLAREEGEDIDAQISMAQRVILEFGKMSNDHVIKDAAALSMGYLDHLERAAEMGDGMTGLATGFTDLDMFLGGLQPTLYVVAGRPAMGKSSFAINVAEHVAINLGKRVLLFSLEMNGDQIVQRIVARRTGINIQALKTARLSDRDWKRVHMAVDAVNKSGLLVDETPGIRPSQAFARASRLSSMEPIDLIIYDHLHLMTSDKYDGNPVKEVGEITEMVFNISKELGVPSVLAAQLNRGVEDRKDKRPILRDLRDSGEIEQNAYCVLFPYRDDYYNPVDTEKMGVAEINIAKNRDGATGTIELLWNRSTASFSNIVRRVI